MEDRVRPRGLSAVARMLWCVPARSPVPLCLDGDESLDVLW